MKKGMAMSQLAATGTASTRPAKVGGHFTAPKVMSAPMISGGPKRKRKPPPKPIAVRRGVFGQGLTSRDMIASNR